MSKIMKSGFYYTNPKREKSIKPLNPLFEYNFTIQLPNIAIIIMVIFPITFPMIFQHISLKTIASVGEKQFVTGEEEVLREVCSVLEQWEIVDIFFFKPQQIGIVRVYGFLGIPKIQKNDLPKMPRFHARRRVSTFFKKSRQFFKFQNYLILFRLIHNTLGFLMALSVHSWHSIRLKHRGWDGQADPGIPDSH